MRTVQVENAATYIFEHITLCPTLSLLFLQTLPPSQNFQTGKRTRSRADSLCPSNIIFYVQNSYFLLELLSYEYSVAFHLILEMFLKQGLAD